MLSLRDDSCIALRTAIMEVCLEELGVYIFVFIPWVSNDSSYSLYLADEQISAS